MTLKIGQICRVINGRAYLMPELQDAGKYRILRVGNFFNSDKWYYSDLELPHDKYCYDGDLLFAWSCSFGPKIWHGEKTIFHYHIWKLVEDESSVYRRWLYYWLINEVVRLTAGNHGSVMMHMTKGEMEEMPIDLPPLATQRKIAGVLGALDDKIELNRKMNANLEAQAQALFKSWFVDFDPWGGKRPSGWREVAVEDLTDRLASGGTPRSMNDDYYHGTIKWFSTKELRDSFLIDSEKHISKEALDNSAAKMFPRDAVLMAIYASPTVGRLGILDDDSTFNQAAVGLLAKREVGYPFIFLTLHNERGNLNNLVSGAAQQNLNVRIVKTYKVLRPDNDVLTSFDKKVRPMFEMMRKNARESRKLAELRDALLPKLMSGELEVA